MNEKEINALLKKSRDQKFRKISETRLESYAKTQSKKRKYHISSSEFRDMFKEWWGPNKGIEIRAKLAKQYNIDSTYIGELMQKPHMYISKKETDEILEHYKQNYDIRAEIYTAGSDILDIMDQAYTQYDVFSLGPIKPSILYKLRFEMDWKRDRAEIIKIGEQFGYSSRNIRDIRQKRWPWLTANTSTVKTLYGEQEISKFKREHKIHREAWGWGSKSNGSARGTKNFIRGSFKGKYAGLFWCVYNA